MKSHQPKRVRDLVLKKTLLKMQLMQDNYTGKIPQGDLAGLIYQYHHEDMIYDKQDPIDRRKRLLESIKVLERKVQRKKAESRDWEGI